MSAVHLQRWPFVLLRAVAAGLLLAASVPPWGWWPLAFVGIAMWDRLIAERPWRSRLLRSTLVASAWLYPAFLWMWDLTAPGYIVAGAVFALYFGIATIAVPPLGALAVDRAARGDRARRDRALDVPVRRRAAWPRSP